MQERDGHPKDGTWQDRPLRQELVDLQLGNTKGLLEEIRSDLNHHKIAKIDKQVIEQARETSREKPDSKKRLDQLLVKKFVRTVLEDEDPNYSDLEEGDELYMPALKQVD